MRRGTHVAAVVVVALAGVACTEGDPGAARPTASATATATQTTATPGATTAPTPTKPPAPTAAPSPTPRPTPARAPMPETFVSEIDERIALYSTATGKRLRYLTARTEFGDMAPTFSADRSRIWFTRQTSDCEATLMEVRPDGTGLRPLFASEGPGPMAYVPVESAHGLVYVDGDCAEGWGTLMLRAPDGSRRKLAEANSMTDAAVSADGRYVYAAMSRWNASQLPEDNVMRQLKRFDLTRRTRDVVAAPERGCRFEGSVVRYVHRGRPSIVAAQRCGTGAAARSSLMVYDEALRQGTRLLSLDALRVLRVGVDPSGRHLLLYRLDMSEGDRRPDPVQRWTEGGKVVTVANDVGAADW